MVSGFEKSPCPGDSVCDIFENEDAIITENYIVWVTTNKEIWKGELINIPFSDLTQDSNHLKSKWIDTKKEDRFLIKNCPREYKKKKSSYINP